MNKRDTIKVEHKQKEGVMTLTNIDVEKLVGTPDDELMNEFPQNVFGLTRAELRKIRREAIKVKKQTAKSVLDTVKKQRAKQVENNANKELAEQVEVLERELNAVAQIKVTPQEYKIVGKSDKQIEAVPFIVASDWHVDEIVRSQTVSELNKFDEKIADYRIQQFFKNAVKLLQVNRNDVKLKQVVLALLGDFISGNIHEEVLENTSMRPIDAMLWVRVS